MKVGRLKEIIAEYKDDADIAVWFYERVEANDYIESMEEGLTPLTETEWSQMCENLNEDKYLNHVINETWLEKLHETLDERKGNGDNQ